MALILLLWEFLPEGGLKTQLNYSIEQPENNVGVKQFPEKMLQQSKFLDFWANPLILSASRINCVVRVLALPSGGSRYEHTSDRLAMGSVRAQRHKGHVTESAELSGIFFL